MSKRRVLPLKISKLLDSPLLYVALAIIGVGLLMSLIIGVNLSTTSQINQASTPPLQIQSMPNTLTSPSETSTQQPSSSQSSNNVNPNSQTSTLAPSDNVYQPYKGPVCTKTTVPYKTYVKLASYLDIGTYQITGGQDGNTTKCSADSLGKEYNYTPLNPVDKIILVGTSRMDSAQPTTTKPNPGVYNRILARCAPVLSGTGNEDAYNYCVSVQEYYFQNWLDY